MRKLIILASVAVFFLAGCSMHHKCPCEPKHHHHHKHSHKHGHKHHHAEQHHADVAAPAKAKHAK